jgi:hypothetical protein
MVEDFRQVGDTPEKKSSVVGKDPAHGSPPSDVSPRPGGAFVCRTLLGGFRDPMRGAECSHVKLLADTHRRVSTHVLAPRGWGTHGFMLTGQRALARDRASGNKEEMRQKAGSR